jgi:hypothetical protein
MWAKKRLLIWGTTYPEFSKKYYETVCTGAVDSDTGKLFRLYPITLRHMKEPFAAYDWIEAEVEKNTADYRPESFKIRQDTITIGEHLGTKDGWAERSKWVLRRGNVFRSVEALKAAESADHTSLGVVKPRRISHVYAKRRPQSERHEWDEHREQAIRQRDLFVDAEAKTKDLVFIPVQYRVEFECNDSACTGHDMSILDWGTYALSRRQFAERGAVQAELDVITKINEMMDPAKRDAHFFLGNTKSHPQNFMIVGMYYPPIQRQVSLF